MSQAPIFNAKDNPLLLVEGTLPNVNDALNDWFLPMTFTVVTKTIVNFQVVETQTNVTFQGNWQPINQRLEMEPHGQRKWPQYIVYADPSLVLNPDDEIIYLGAQYRVLTVKDFIPYGYRSYELVLDYST